MSTTTPVQAPHPSEPGPRRRRLWFVLLAAAGVLVVVLAGTVLIRSRSTSDTTEPAGPTPTVTGTSPAPPATSGPATPAPTATPTPPQTPSPSTPAGGTAFAFVPLWPFAGVGDAVAWQQQAAGGHQPWRLDAGETALTFTRSFLGYTEMTRVVSTRTTADQAWIGVAADPPEGRPAAAAVLHLARIGTGPLTTRPWEVVGSEDTFLTLTTPRYGSVVGPVLTAGGRITGVDESLTIQVKMLGDQVLGRVSGITAGGQNQPWSAELAVAPDHAGPAVVAVSTGGHLLAVERFAITGVQVRATRSFATSQQALASLVSGGTYIGRCDGVTGTPTATRPVCSNELAQHGSRYLYRIGYWGTDNGFFAVLARTDAGRWVIVSPRIAGADVPVDLRGPIPE